MNAEFIYRGSIVAPTNQIALPTVTHKQEVAAAVEHHMEAILDRPPAAASEDAHQLWNGMINTRNYPTDKDVLKLIAYFQFAHIRDKLMADIPGIDTGLRLFMTPRPPTWHRWLEA